MPPGGSSSGRGEPVVLRFSATERARHWAFALPYLALLATGLPLLFPELRGWIRGYTPIIGLRLHLAGAFLWVAVTALVVLVGDRATLTRTWNQLRRFDGHDAAWLRSFPRWLIASEAQRARVDHAVERFNAGQKVNALFTVLTSALLLLTGLALIPLPEGILAARVTGPASVPLWQEAHRWLTLVILLPIAGHVALALAFAPTRPALPGILGGRVDRRWAALHHPRWHPDARDEDRVA